MTKMKSVLLVDDSRADNRINRLILTRSGAVDDEDVFVAHDGIEAWEFLTDPTAPERLGERFPPALILVDVNMPRLDGLGLVERLDALYGEGKLASTLILMLTSSVDAGDRRRAIAARCVQGFLNKPLTFDKARELAERASRG